MRHPPTLPQANPARRRMPWRLILWTCLPPLMVVAMLALWLIQYDRGLAADTEALYAEQDRIAAAMEAEGLPVSNETWSTLHPPPDPAENAAPVYTKAFASVTPLPPQHTFDVPFVGKADAVPPGTTYAAASRDAMRAHLDANQTALSLADTARGLTRAQFDSYTVDEGAIAPRDIATAVVALLSLRVEVMAIDGTEAGLGEAVHSLHSAIQMLDPDAIDVLVALRMRRDYSLLLARLYVWRPPTASLLDAVNRLSWRQRADDLYARSAAHNAGRIEFDEQTGMFLLLDDKRLLLPFPERYKEKWVTRMIAEYGVLDLTYRRDVLGFLEGTARDVGPALEVVKRDYERDAPTGMMLFSVSVSLEPVWLARGYGRMLELANAIAQHRMVNGTLPPSLDPLISAARSNKYADPYDGAPIRYQRDDTGFVLYCVGPNLTDDGGAAYEPKARQAGQGDIVLAFHAQPENLRTGAVAID